MNFSARKKIAILGATGHIAKSLIYCLSTSSEYELCLFARSTDRLKEFLLGISYGGKVLAQPFSEFNGGEYNVIINCVGIGDPAKLEHAGASIFKLTEEYDNLILNYLDHHPEVVYINLSSGAAYGTDFCEPADESTSARIELNHIVPSDCYGIAKINSEAKHRALTDLKIIDLRIFGYFSRFIDLEAGYLLSEVVASVRNREAFVTDNQNIFRDYIHPQDFKTLINLCLEQGFLNDVFDVYSLKPVTKFEILDFFAGEYGLEYIVKDQISLISATGCKVNYYSVNQKAQKIGYIPQFTSLESIVQESKAILEG